MRPQRPDLVPIDVARGHARILLPGQHHHVLLGGGAYS